MRSLGMGETGKMDRETRSDLADKWEERPGKDEGHRGKLGGKQNTCGERAISEAAPACKCEQRCGSGVLREVRDKGGMRRPHMCVGVRESGGGRRLFVVHDGLWGWPHECELEGACRHVPVVITGQELPEQMLQVRMGMQGSNRSTAGWYSGGRHQQWCKGALQSGQQRGGEMGGRKWECM